MEAVPADDVGRRRCMISDKCRERTKQNAGHELEVQNEDLSWNMSEDFAITQEFSFAKVRIISLFFSFKQTP